MEHDSISLRIAGRVRHSSVDGPGVRYVLFFQGCPHRCPLCQNPDTHDMAGGEFTDTSSEIARLRNVRYLDGITFSGGDPFVQPEALGKMAEAARGMGLDVWCYTGYLFEDLLKEAQRREEISKALREIDVLVDGPYIDSLNAKRSAGGTAGCSYRGSTNQRLIDVRRSLAEGQTVLYRA